MPRSARIVYPGCPHHVIQRGNRQQRVFFESLDYETYRHLMAESCVMETVQCWAYCLMPNHVHLVLVPDDEAGLSRAVSRAYRLYTRFINARTGTTGHLWQGRFKSFVLNEAHLVSACRYIELNPVRAALTARVEEWRWSSVHAHLSGRDDELARVRPMQDRVSDWREYLNAVDPYA